jgi:hypothetical protein
MYRGTRKIDCTVESKTQGGKWNKIGEAIADADLPVGIDKRIPSPHHGQVQKAMHRCSELLPVVI